MRTFWVLQTYAHPPPCFFLRRARADAQAGLCPGGCSASPPLRRIAVVGMGTKPRRARNLVSGCGGVFAWASAKSPPRSDESQRWGWGGPLVGRGRLAPQSHRTRFGDVSGALRRRECFRLRVGPLTCGVGLPAMRNHAPQLSTNPCYVKLPCDGSRRLAVGRHVKILAV